jgi:ABC-type nickel/cobalt efflux system permease component RcnA
MAVITASFSTELSFLKRRSCACSLPVLNTTSRITITTVYRIYTTKVHEVIKSIDADREKPKHSQKKTHSHAILSTTNPRQTGSSMDPSQSGQWPVLAQTDMKHEFHTGTIIT